ncbi:MAG: hypothetical protein ACJ8F1_11810 [Polyangia bacterium]
MLHLRGLLAQLTVAHNRTSHDYSNDDWCAGKPIGEPSSDFKSGFAAGPVPVRIVERPGFIRRGAAAGGVAAQPLSKTVLSSNHFVSERRRSSRHVIANQTKCQRHNVS